MKTHFSPAWLQSKQPRKQRKYRYNAPLHLRQKMLSAHLDKALRREHKRRSMRIAAGDEVVVVRGEHRKRRGKVSEVDLKKLKIYIDGVTRKKISGQESKIAIDPSNVVITKLDMDDKKRLKAVRRKQPAGQEKMKESKADAASKMDDK